MNINGCQKPILDARLNKLRRFASKLENLSLQAPKCVESFSCTKECLLCSVTNSWRVGSRPKTHAFGGGPTEMPHL
jgi:hypothetical protein